MQQQPRLTSREVKRYAKGGEYLLISQTKRLAEDCLAYMDALEQICDEAKNSAGADTLWNIEMVARAVLPASEEATDATP